MDFYDLIVIGTGTAAQTAAGRVRRAGRSVAVIDHRPFGGTCALRGCDPKKMLVSGAEAVDFARRMHKRGVAGELHIDWKALIAFKRTFTDPIPSELEESFAKQGITAYHGLARFTGPDRVAVDSRVLQGGHILIASGARPEPLHFPTGNTVTAIERAGSEYRVHMQTPEGEGVIAADVAVHAAGRVPDIAELDLSTANTVVVDGQLQLNDFLQSVSNPTVYAAGDASAKGPPLTPVSSHDANVVAANILEGNSHRPDYRGVPSVAFTLPPIAAVGLSEVAARKQARKLRVNSANVPDWYTARRVGESVYGCKTLIEEDSGRILGAHLVGPHADEVINLFGLAIRHDLTIDDLKSTIFAYPTGASDIGYML
jgi:pyruvate/2-oxoglutarate dehydrogenase complex dihydrolipoamide dehydrogenase (E3) component